MEIELLTAFSPRPTRRRLQARGPVLRFLGLLAIASAPGFLPSSLLPASSASDLIRDENRKAGATDWQLTRVRPDRQGFRSPWIEGYCSKQSVKAGESDRHHGLDRPAAAVPDRDLPHGLLRRPRRAADDDARAVRGQGAAGPRARRRRTCTSAGGSRPRRSTIPADWPSGVYLGRLTTVADPADEPYWQSYVVFIVRDDRPADILFQCSDNTWQAYNRWPSNYSVYTHPKGNQGPWADVSFDRPYGREAQYDGVVNDPAHGRLGRVPAARVPAGLLARAARLRRDLLLATATWSRRIAA